MRTNVTVHQRSSSPRVSVGGKPISRQFTLLLRNVNFQNSCFTRAGLQHISIRTLLSYRDLHREPRLKRLSDTSAKVSHFVLLPLLPQPPPPLTLIRLVQNPYNTHSRLLTNLLSILTNQHRTRRPLIVWIASILQMTHKTEVNRSGSEPVQRESRRRSPVELATEWRFRQGRVGRGCHDSLSGLVVASGWLESDHLHSLGKPYCGSLRRAG